MPRGTDDDPPITVVINAVLAHLIKLQESIREARDKLDHKLIQVIQYRRTLLTEQDAGRKPIKKRLVPLATEVRTSLKYHISTRIMDQANCLFTIVCISASHAEIF